ncbi:MAG: zinc ribbon domain-containing protein [Thermoplasmata archaeon]|nr:zinc ribbon domain-containing protein [Thermoplasmata archaeon]
MNENRSARRARPWVGVVVVTVVLLVGGFSFGDLVSAGAAHTPIAARVAVVSGANSPLTINSLTVSPDPVSEGSQFSVDVQVSGGQAPYIYNWGPVPGGCPNPGNTASWGCTISSSGEYSVGVNVGDSGSNHTSASRTFNVTSNGGSGNGGGKSGNSNGNGSNGFNLSSFGPFLLYGLIAGLVVFALLIILTVGVIAIAVILSRRLPRPPRGTLVCAKCQATAPAGSKFCPSCAAPLTPPKTE